jgi:predicted DNA-binding transcriptional regulator AlpA
MTNAQSERFVVAGIFISTARRRSPFRELKMDEPKKLIYKAEARKRIGLSFTTIWKYMRQGTFPRSRECGGKTCWLESEIDAWILARPIRRLKGDPE